MRKRCSAQLLLRMLTVQLLLHWRIQDNVLDLRHAKRIQYRQGFGRLAYRTKREPTQIRRLIPRTPRVPLPSKRPKHLTSTNTMKTARTIEPTPVYKNVPGLVERLPDALRTRRAVMIGEFLLLGLGMTLNLGWLTAVGSAPILLALASCAAICAVGIKSRVPLAGRNLMIHTPGDCRHNPRARINTASVQSVMQRRWMFR